MLSPMWSFARDRRGAVALMTALLAPVLLGVAGFAVDAGYWYGTGASLKAATNAAALAAARAEMYGMNGQAAVRTVATAAASQAVSLIAAPAPVLQQAGATIAARDDLAGRAYLSSALGIAGAHLAALSRASTVQVQTKPEAGCLMVMNQSATQAIYASGGARITAENCGIYAASAAKSTTQGAGNAIYAAPSASITGQAIGAVGGVYADTNGGAYIGVITAAGTTTAGIQQNMTPLPDPLAALGDVPLTTEPGYPSTPVDLANQRQKLGYVAPFADAWGGCTGSYTGDCYLNAGGFDGGMTISTNQLVLRTGAATPNGAGTYVVTGGTDITASESLSAGTAVTFEPGSYYFQGNGSYALSVNAPSVDFQGGTYFFDGGLDLASNDKVTFGPGIYIISGGNLVMGGSANITSTGATFILENGAGFTFNGNSGEIDMSAPQTNCLPMAQYPEPALASGPPYDGTGGEGICGVLLYQARDDSAADSIAGSATETFDGIIYTPAAPLALSGTGTLASSNPADFNLTLGVIADTMSVTGSAQVTLQAAPNSPLSDAGATTYQPVLVR